jgi:hypothetical protein
VGVSRVSILHNPGYRPPWLRRDSCLCWAGSHKNRDIGICHLRTNSARLSWRMGRNRSADRVEAHPVKSIYRATSFSPLCGQPGAN